MRSKRPVVAIYRQTNETKYAELESKGFQALQVVTMTQSPLLFQKKQISLRIPRVRQCKPENPSSSPLNGKNGHKNRRSSKIIEWFSCKNGQGRVSNRPCKKPRPEVPSDFVALRILEGTAQGAVLIPSSADGAAVEVVGAAPPPGTRP